MTQLCLLHATDFAQSCARLYLHARDPQGKHLRETSVSLIFAREQCLVDTCARQVSR